MQNVKIVNEGINWISPSNVYWKHDVERSESVKIILHGNAEFEAKDVVLKVQLLINSAIVHNSLFLSYFLTALFYQGNHVFEVPDGQRMFIVQDRAGFQLAVSYNAFCALLYSLHSKL